MRLNKLTMKVILFLTFVYTFISEVWHRNALKETWTDIPKGKKVNWDLFNKVNKLILPPEVCWFLVFLACIINLL